MDNGIARRAVTRMMKGHRELHRADGLSRLLRPPAFSASRSARVESIRCTVLHVPAGSTTTASVYRRAPVAPRAVTMRALWALQNKIALSRAVLVAGTGAARAEGRRGARTISHHQHPKITMRAIARWCGGACASNRATSSHEMGRTARHSAPTSSMSGRNNNGSAGSPSLGTGANSIADNASIADAVADASTMASTRSKRGLASDRPKGESVRARRLTRLTRDSRQRSRQHRVPASSAVAPTPASANPSPVGHANTVAKSAWTLEAVATATGHALWRAPKSSAVKVALAAAAAACAATSAPAADRHLASAPTSSCHSGDAASSHQRTTWSAIATATARSARPRRRTGSLRARPLGPSGSGRCGAPGERVLAACRSVPSCGMAGPRAAGPPGAGGAAPFVQCGEHTPVLTRETFEHGREASTIGRACKK